MVDNPPVQQVKQLGTFRVKVSLVTVFLLKRGMLKKSAVFARAKGSSIGMCAWSCNGKIAWKNEVVDALTFQAEMLCNASSLFIMIWGASWARASTSYNPKLNIGIWRRRTILLGQLTKDGIDLRTTISEDHLHITHILLTFIFTFPMSLKERLENLSFVNKGLCLNSKLRGLLGT